MINTCGNCKFFNEYKEMVNKENICNYHGFTVNPSNLGCYLIQYNKRIEKNLI